MRIIRTRYGSVSLTKASRDELATVARYWPFGLHPGSLPDAPLRLGFQLEGEPLRCIKFQQADFSEADAQLALFDNVLAIASALPEYLKAGHPGVLSPVPYFRPKPSGRVETGISYFCGPVEREVSPQPDRRFDEYVGSGATAMIFDLQGAITRVGKSIGPRCQYFLSMERRHAGEIGRMSLRFLTVGPSLLILDKSLPEEGELLADEIDPMWGCLARAGLENVSYAAATPAVISRQPPDNHATSLT